MTNKILYFNNLVLCSRNSKIFCTRLKNENSSQFQSFETSLYPNHGDRSISKLFNFLKSCLIYRITANVSSNTFVERFSSHEIFHFDSGSILVILTSYRSLVCTRPLIQLGSHFGRVAWTSSR